VLYSSSSPLYALRHQSRPPLFVVDFRITPSRARRTLRPTNRNTFHPLQASTIEEASIDGNLLVHDNVYLVQLNHSPDDLNNLAIPTFNDQLTNVRIRGGQHLRQKDVSSWERREIFQLGFGSFHLAMNLLWCVLETHRGTLNQTGSLTHLFAVLEKTRLGGEHPDYHTLLSALTQIMSRTRSLFGFLS
jgi:hypothetical protein